MSASRSKSDTDVNQRILFELVAQPGNDVCADCKRHAPRWASHNLGIFLCITCATVHRKIGTHVSRVKSLTLDSWSREQIDVMKKNGNIKSNQHFNPDERRHPPPANLDDSDRGSELENYIRDKYERKRFLQKTPARPASTSASATLNVPAPQRSKSTPLVAPNSATINPTIPVARTHSPLPPIPQAQLASQPPPATSSMPLRAQSASAAPMLNPPPTLSISSPPVVPMRTGLSSNVLQDMMSIQSNTSQSSLAASSPSMSTSSSNQFPPTGSTSFHTPVQTSPFQPFQGQGQNQPQPFHQPYGGASTLSTTSSFGPLTPGGAPSLPTSLSNSPFATSRSTSLPVHYSSAPPSGFVTPSYTGVSNSQTHPFGMRGMGGSMDVVMQSPLQSPLQSPVGGGGSNPFLQQHLHQQSQGMSMPMHTGAGFTQPAAAFGGQLQQQPMFAGQLQIPNQLQQPFQMQTQTQSFGTAPAPSPSPVNNNMSNNPFANAGVPNAFAGSSVLPNSGPFGGGY